MNSSSDINGADKTLENATVRGVLVPQKLELRCGVCFDDSVSIEYLNESELVELFARCIWEKSAGGSGI